jgi:hypothetical protein
MDNFNEYLKGSRFTLYRDLATETTLGTTQLKTLNRLRNTMIDHDFKTLDRQKADLPEHLKKRQTRNEPELSGQDQAFNKVIHVDLIDIDHSGSDSSARAILSITDDTRTLTWLAVLADNRIDSVATTIWHHWCQPYGNPETIRSDRGKVWTSKLESRINNLGPLEPKITCRSERESFNPEIRQQWQQSRLDMPAEEFAQAWNLLCNLRPPGKGPTGLNDLDQIDQDLDDIEDFVEHDVDLEDHRVGKLKPQIPI